MAAEGPAGLAGTAADLAPSLSAGSPPPVSPADAPAASPAPVSLGPIKIANPLEWQAPMRNYPRPDTFSYQGDAMVAEYAPDSLLNARVNFYLQRYRPETGVIMIADLRSGHILAMGERQDSLITEAPKLAYGGGFPAASLIAIGPI